MPVPRQALQLCGAVGCPASSLTRASLVVGAPRAHLGERDAIIALLVAVGATAAPPGTRRRPAELALVALVVVLAGALRLWSLAKVPSDPFYDASVLSMPLSLHNFLLGAYEPGGSLAIDKPPMDLWLQVLSTQLFGFGSFTLKLPSALAGTAAVAVLYDAVRRVLGAGAGVASALALATLPIALLTARSDTVDAAAMLLSVIALWLLVRFAADGRSRWCYLAAAAMGLAFNVKLFEGIVGLPALILFGFLVCRERRLVRLALSAVVFVAVSLSWLTMTLLFPASDRPYAIGSTNGSAWNATFVFNGWDRIAGAETQSALNAQLPASALHPANNSEVARSAVPIGPPALLRLFDHDGPLSGLRLGFMLLAALALGVPALIWTIVRARGPDSGVERAFAASLLLWLVIGVVLYSVMARLHPRYTEGFTPAVAAVAGIGVAWALRDGLWQRLFTLVAALALALYGRYLLGASAADLAADRDRRDHRGGSAARAPRARGASRCVGARPRPRDPGAAAAGGRERDPQRRVRQRAHGRDGVGHGRRDQPLHPRPRRRAHPLRVRRGGSYRGRRADPPRPPGDPLAHLLRQPRAAGDSAAAGPGRRRPVALRAARRRL